jgi:hypothetical protein
LTPPEADQGDCMLTSRALLTSLRPPTQSTTHGKKNIQFADMILLRFYQQCRCSGKRDKEKVKNKIEHIEKQFKSAHDFSQTETGVGLKDNDPEGSFKEIMLKKCPWYFDLLDIMVDRASKAKVTSDELDTDEDDIVGYDLNDDSKDSDDDKDDLTSKRPFRRFLYRRLGP